VPAAVSVPPDHYLDLEHALGGRLKRGLLRVRRAGIAEYDHAQHHRVAPERVSSATRQRDRIGGPGAHLRPQIGPDGGHTCWQPGSRLWLPRADDGCPSSPPIRPERTIAPEVPPTEARTDFVSFPTQNSRQGSRADTLCFQRRYLPWGRSRSLHAERRVVSAAKIIALRVKFISYSPRTPHPP
jgi:hypothetical protein